MPLLIREGPATELVVATRILAHLGRIERGGVALLVGSEVVYLPARGIAPATLTPYDLAALRLGDASVLAGAPPDDAERYLAALRTRPGDRAAALLAEGDVVTAADVVALVEGAAGMPWTMAQASAQAAGALVGAYPLPG